MTTGRESKPSFIAVDITGGNLGLPDVRRATASMPSSGTVAAWRGLPQAHWSIVKRVRKNQRKQQC